MFSSPLCLYSWPLDAGCAWYMGRVCPWAKCAYTHGPLSSYVGCACYMGHWCYEPKVHLRLAYRYDVLVLRATKVSALLGPMCVCGLSIWHVGCAWYMARWYYLEESAASLGLLMLYVGCACCYILARDAGTNVHLR